MDRDYFENVLSDQIRLMGGRVRLSLHLFDGTVVEVWSLVAAHDRYVILEAHPLDGDPPDRPERWQRENPEAPPWIFDQVAISYGSIVRTTLTAEKGTPAGSDRPIGFHGHGANVR